MKQVQLCKRQLQLFGMSCMFWLAITIELCVMITVSWTQQNGQIYKIVIFCSAIPRDVYLLSAYGTSKVDQILPGS